MHLKHKKHQKTIPSLDKHKTIQNPGLITSYEVRLRGAYSYNSAAWHGVHDRRRKGILKQLHYIDRTLSYIFVL